MNPSAVVKPFETTAVKRHGCVRFRNPKAFAQFTAQLRDDQELVVTFEKAHATRSLDQNALYWAGYVTPLAEYTGRPPRVVHALLKKLFLPKERIEIVDKRTGVVVDEVDLEALTTTTLNKIEFGEYLKEIEEWVMDTFHGDVHVGSNREHAA